MKKRLARSFIMIGFRVPLRTRRHDGKRPGARLGFPSPRAIDYVSSSEVTFSAGLAGDEPQPTMMDGKQLRAKLVGPEDERAVSPVIGVILMVAITVILAAVIAAFVLDIGPGDSSVNAGASVSEAGDTVTVTVNDVGNADGIVLANGNGVPVEKDSGEDALTVTGTSADYSDVDGEYIVYAFEGDAEDLTTISDYDSAATDDPLEDQVSTVTVINDGDISN